MYFVGYTSNDGVTIGSMSDSLVTAIAEMCEQFGEEFIHLYAHGKSEIHDSIGRFYATSPEEVATVYQQLQAQKGDVADVEGTGDRLAGDDPAEGDVDRDDPGTEAEPLPDRSPTDSPTLDVGAAADVVAPPSAVPEVRCVVCGDITPPDVAKASQLMVGELRCAECMALR